MHQGRRQSRSSEPDRNESDGAFVHRRTGAGPANVEMASSVSDSVRQEPKGSVSLSTGAIGRMRSMLGRDLGGAGVVRDL